MNCIIETQHKTLKRRVLVENLYRDSLVGGKRKGINEEHGLGVA